MTIYQLAIECSGMGGEVAWCAGADVVSARTLEATRGSVQTMAPVIAELTETRPPDFISVTHGPGSFTGLRVGLATAKMLAYAWQCPLVAVDTLAAVARGASYGDHTKGEPVVVIAVLNAFRRQVFAAAWHRENDAWNELAASQVIDAANWQQQPLQALQPRAEVAAGERPWGRWESARCVVLGPGVEVYPPSPHARVEVARAEWWQPRAAHVAAIGWEKFLAGQTTSALELLPNYLRASAAQERRAASRNQ